MAFKHIGKTILMNPAIIQDLLISLFCSVLFLSGIGRYRIVVFIICYYVAKVILKLISDSNIRFLFYPLAVLMLYLDIKYGQIFPIIKSNSVVAPLAVFILMEITLNNVINLIVERFTHSKLFAFCPACNYENFTLVSTCNNCKYSTDAIHLENHYKYDCSRVHDFYLDRSYSDDLVSKKCINLLCLNRDEKIFHSIKITPFRGVYKNRSKIVCKYVVITTSNVIIIDYRYNLRGWSLLDKIPYNTVKESKMTKEKRGIADAPKLSILLNDGTEYTIFYNLDESTEQRFSTIARYINNQQGVC